MAKNAGKIFEEYFEKSTPDYCLVERFKDTAQSYNRTAKFTTNNPCDYLMFDSLTRTLYFLELKTTKSTSISFDDVRKNKSDGKMIKKHQIEGLTKFAEYEGVEAGFLFNFRDEEKGIERTFYFSIDKFNKFCYNTDKKSINEIDLILNGAIIVMGEKKRVHYYWDIDGMMKTIAEKNALAKEKEKEGIEDEI